MALTHYERTKRYRMRLAGKELPPTPKAERGAEIRRLMAAENISRRTAFRRLAKLRDMNDDVA